MESGCSSCQNQDLRDYGIFRILAARLLTGGRSFIFGLAGFSVMAKSVAGRGEILKNPANPSNPDSDGADLRAAPAWAILKSAWRCAGVRMKIEYSEGEDALYVYLKEVEVSRSEDVD